MPSTGLGYRLAVRLGTALAPALGVVDPKIRTGHQARRGGVGRLSRWAEQARDPSRPLAWFHASSVGEGLQAESVLTRFRRLRPECQLIYTHFSPSAESLARRLPVDAADYLPYDAPRAADALLQALRPDLLVFSKLDLWPELATRAAARGTRVVLVAATVSPASGRLRWPARQLLAPGYAAATGAAAISNDDAERLARLGVIPDRIRVLGDPRYDSVAERVRAVPPDDPLLRLGAGTPTLVAGSTWPGDETVLFDAFARIHVRHPEARLILVPHEPTPDHLAKVEGEAARRGLPAPARLSAVERPAPVPSSAATDLGLSAQPVEALWRLLLVDRTGVLAALYGAGTMAYVGGGFGRAGLHSVLEPAAWGLPVVFGPHWQQSRDAGRLLKAGAAEALPASDPAELLRHYWENWIVDETRRHAQGERAKAVVEEGRGAADRTAAWLAAAL